VLEQRKYGKPLEIRLFRTEEYNFKNNLNFWYCLVDFTFLFGLTYENPGHTAA
jgi:hypothetical protein